MGRGIAKARGTDEIRRHGTHPESTFELPVPLGQRSETRRLLVVRMVRIHSF